MTGRVLGLDIGDVRIGVAISDPTGLFAQALETIVRTSKWEDVTKIREIMERHEISTVVVGLPKNMNNTLGPQGKKVMKFTNALKHNYPVDVIFEDERLTTVSAERILVEGNLRRKDRRAVVDQVAATFILQTYLDRERKDE